MKKVELINKINHHLSLDETMVVWSAYKTKNIVGLNKLSKLAEVAMYFVTNKITERLKSFKEVNELSYSDEFKTCLIDCPTYISDHNLQLFPELYEKIYSSNEDKMVCIELDVNTSEYGIVDCGQDKIKFLFECSKKKSKNGYWKINFSYTFNLFLNIHPTLYVFDEIVEIDLGTIEIPFHQHFKIPFLKP